MHRSMCMVLGCAVADKRMGLCLHTLDLRVCRVASPLTSPKDVLATAS